MAKVSFPLHSISASGKIGENLIFIQRGGKQTARFQRPQKDYSNFARDFARLVYSNAVAAWQQLSYEEKLEWSNLANSLHMTGYNFFVKDFIENAVSGKSYYGDHSYGDFLFGDQ